MVDRQKKKIKISIQTEEVPLITIYRKNGKLDLRVNELDKDSFSPLEVIGFLRVYIRQLEDSILYDDD